MTLRERYTQGVTRVVYTQGVTRVVYTQSVYGVRGVPRVYTGCERCILGVYHGVLGYTLGVYHGRLGRAYIPLREAREGIYTTQGG